MKRMKHLLAAGGLVFCGLSEGVCQVEVIERLPEESVVAHWQPVFFERIVSYVQLPGDSAEYKKIKMYVVYRARPGIEKEEEMLRVADLSRRRYLGAKLVRTGRTFEKLLDDTVFGVENVNLTTQDQLINNEMRLTNGDMAH